MRRSGSIITGDIRCLAHRNGFTFQSLQKDADYKTSERDTITAEPTQEAQQSQSKLPGLTSLFQQLGNKRGVAAGFIHRDTAA